MIRAKTVILALGMGLLWGESWGNCVDFEGFTVGQTFSFGQQFLADGVPIEMRDYFNGEVSFFDRGEIVSSSPHAGNALGLSNATALIDTGCAERVRLHYGYSGGGASLEVDGDVAYIKGIFEVNYQLGDVAVTVTQSGSTGTIELVALSGTISSIRIGGQEFVIDHICIDACASSNCFQFEDMDERGLGVGESYLENGSAVEILAFGNNPTGASGSISNEANHVGTEMGLKGATARFAPGCAGGASFYYAQNQNGIVLNINGSSLQFDTIEDLDGLTLAGVAISVVDGKVTLSGLIEGLEIGGNSLFIDNLCFAECPRNCIDFEELPAGSRFKDREEFMEDGILMTVTDYEGTADVLIETNQRAGHFGHDAALFDAMLTFGFGCANEITLHFGQYAQGVMIRHAEGSEAVASLMDLHGVITGGVLVEVDAVEINGVLLGTLKLTGDQIQNFSIGGAELVIDHVCHVPCPNRACVEFEVFPFGKVYREFDVLIEEYTRMVVQRFSGAPTTPTATISGTRHAGGSGNELVLNNAQLRLQFLCAATVTIPYAIVPGGFAGVRLGVNGDSLQVNNFTALNQQPLGGTFIQVAGTPNAGTITITGSNITTVTVGGNDIAVDQICHTECTVDGTCATFHTLPVSATYLVEQSDFFVSDGLTFIATSLDLDESTIVDNGRIEVSTENRANFFGREIRMVNSTATVAGLPCSEEISFRFGDYGDTVNVFINGQRLIVPSMASLDGQQLAGVNMEVSTLPAPGGTVGLFRASGQINDFAIGGTDLYLDQFCHVPCDVFVLGQAKIISADPRGSSPRTVIIEVQVEGGGNPLLQYNTSLAPSGWSNLSATVSTPAGRPNVRRFAISAPSSAERLFFRFAAP